MEVPANDNDQVEDSTYEMYPIVPETSPIILIGVNYLWRMKFVLSPVSEKKFSVTGFLKENWKIIKSDLFSGSLPLLNFTSLFITEFVMTLTKSKMTAKLIDFIYPNRPSYVALKNFFNEEPSVRDCPTVRVLASKISANFAISVLFYPLETTFIRCVMGKETLTSLPKLFSDYKSFRSLFCGFGYHFLYSLIHYSCYIAEELVYQRMNDSEPSMVLTVCNLALFTSAGTLFSLRSLFARSGVSNDWSMSLMRFFRLLI